MDSSLPFKDRRKDKKSKSVRNKTKRKKLTITKKALDNVSERASEEQVAQSVSWGQQVDRKDKQKWEDLYTGVPLEFPDPKSPFVEGVLTCWCIPVQSQTRANLMLMDPATG